MLILSDAAAAAATGGNPKQGPLDGHPSNVAAGRAAVIVGVVILGAVLAVLVRRRADPSRAADGERR